MEHGPAQPEVIRAIMLEGSLHLILGLYTDLPGQPGKLRGLVPHDLQPPPARPSVCWHPPSLPLVGVSIRDNTGGGGAIQTTCSPSARRSSYGPSRSRLTALRLSWAASGLAVTKALS